MTHDFTSPPSIAASGKEQGVSRAFVSYISSQVADVICKPKGFDVP